MEKSKMTIRHLALVLFMMCAIAITVVSGSSTTYAASAGDTGYVKCSSLNLRKDPSTKHKRVVKLKKNDKVTIKSVSGKWYKVTAVHGGKKYKGYVQASYIKITSSSTSTSESSSSTSSSDSNTGYVNIKGLYLREGASTSYATIVTLYKNDKVTIESSKGKWYQVTAVHKGNTYSGYVYSTYITRN